MAKGAYRYPEVNTQKQNKERLNARWHTGNKPERGLDSTGEMYVGGTSSRAKDKLVKSKDRLRSSSRVSEKVGKFFRNATKLTVTKKIYNKAAKSAIKPTGKPRRKRR